MSATTLSPAPTAPGDAAALEALRRLDPRELERRLEAHLLIARRLGRAL